MSSFVLRSINDKIEKLYLWINVDEFCQHLSFTCEGVLELTLEGLSEVLTDTAGIVYDTLKVLQQMNSGSSIDYSENKNATLKIWVTTNKVKIFLLVFL